jgi:TrmH family RNA methyltransferase
MPLQPLKWYKKLSARKTRQESGAFTVEVSRAIGQIMAAAPESIREILAVVEPPSIFLDYPLRIVTESQFQSICHTRNPQGIMAVVALPSETYTASLPEKTGTKILLLEDIQDPGNIGTLIRTAAAFDFSGVIMTESCADPFAPKVVQASAGSVLSLWLRRIPGYQELIQKLKESGYILAAADVEGRENPSVLTGQENIILALGNEASGLSDTIISTADYCIGIPIRRNKVESLNVAACGAILMYLCARL